MEYPKPIEHLIEQIRRLPSIGYKSAERLAFSLIDWSSEDLATFARALTDLKSNLFFCDSCGAMKHGEECRYCQEQRDNTTLCIVASPKDIYLFEQTGEYKGLYQVLGAMFSPLHQRAPPQERIETLKQRIVNLGVQEVILALDATLEGDATSLYVKKEIGMLPVSISRLALGIPMGSALDYVDGGTLARAFSGRRSL